MKKHWLTGLVLLVVVGAIAGTLRRPEPMSMKKYTNAVARPALTATRGVPPGLRAQLDKLFTVAGKSVWVGRGPAAAQTVLSGDSASLNDCTIQDRFPAGTYAVMFNVSFNQIPALGATLTFQLTLDGATVMGDHTSRSVTFQAASGAQPGPVVMGDIIPIAEGAHSIGLLMTMAAGAVSFTVPANGAIAVVQQL